MKKDEGNWVVVYMAHRAEDAERVQARLADEGFLVRARPASGGDGVYELCCLSGEAREAHRYLTENDIN